MLSTSVPETRTLRVWNLDAMTFIKHTPDASDLFKKETWNVFFYDEFREGVPADAVGFTQENYIVYRHRQSDVLVAMAANEKDEILAETPWVGVERKRNIAPAARVKGTIHNLTPSQMISIDNDLENGVVFERKRIKVLVPMHHLVMGGTVPGRKRGFFQMSVSAIDCWVWEAKRDVWEPKINNFEYKVADLQQPDSLWINVFYTKEQPRQW